VAIADRLRSEPPKLAAFPLEQNDEGAAQRARSITLETIAIASDDSAASLQAIAS
jgi:hypothetical protein